jgi:protein phosphatase
MEFKSFGFSDPGKVRNNNEDSFLCNENEGLFLVADGMGGHASGETASKLAIDSVERFVIDSRTKKSIEWPVKYNEDLCQEQNRLLAATFTGNLKIQEAGSRNPSMEGMGTTLTGCLVDSENLVIVNVGDSRLYRIRDGEINQITRDQSLIGEWERRGELTREEALRHPKKHVLTGALGHLNSSSDIDVFKRETASKDLYLICSDGLYNMIEDEKILSIISSIKDKSLYKIGLSLALNANLSGGRDNITVVLLYFYNKEM